MGDRGREGEEESGIERLVKKRLGGETGERGVEISCRWVGWGQPGYAKQLSVEIFPQEKPQFLSGV